MRAPAREELQEQYARTRALARERPGAMPDASPVRVPAREGRPKIDQNARARVPAREAGEFRDKYAPARPRARGGVSTRVRARARSRAKARTMKVQRPKLRTSLDPGDLERIVAAIIDGATYAQAAMAAGVRPSALRLAKRCDAGVAARLRAAWQAQARRLREAMKQGTP